MPRPATIRLLALGLAALASLPAQAPKEITWHNDLTAARELAAKKGTPLFVTFRCEP